MCHPVQREIPHNQNRVYWPLGWCVQGAIRVAENHGLEKGRYLALMACHTCDRELKRTGAAVKVTVEAQEI